MNIFGSKPNSTLPLTSLMEPVIPTKYPLSAKLYSFNNLVNALYSVASAKDLTLIIAITSELSTTDVPKL